MTVKWTTKKDDEVVKLLQNDRQLDAVKIKKMKGFQTHTLTNISNSIERAKKNNKSLKLILDSENIDASADGKKKYLLILFFLF